MKALAALGVVVTAIAVPSLASAQTRVMVAHAETASILECLLGHGPRKCSQHFAGSGRLEATPWLWRRSHGDFVLGDLVSWTYAGTQSATGYTTKFLSGRTADVYAVKFRHGEETFYIVPPGPDGRVHYMHVRSGAPNDEHMEGGLHAFN